MKNYVLYRDIKCFIDLKILESKELFTNILEPDHINYIYDIIIKIIKENENIEIAGKEIDIIIKNANELDNEEKKVNDIQSENQTIKKKKRSIDISQLNDDIIDDDKKEEPNDEKEKKEKNEIDNNKKIITENNLRIKEELQKLISYSIIQPNKKNINSKNQYLYAINRIWLENAKSFLDNYRFLIGSELLKEFLNESFDPEYVSLWYLSDEKIQVNPQKHNYFPFPGPINNIPITSYKDQWIDMRIKDENDLIQKNARNSKDYYLIEYDDWRLLKNIFQFTNEIKREKDNIDMINFGVIILDQRFKKFKNFNINLLKKKNIQIGKKKTISDFIYKINRVVNYEIYKINNENNKMNKIDKNNNNVKDNNNKDSNDNKNEIKDNKNKENYNEINHNKNEDNKNENKKNLSNNEINNNNNKKNIESITYKRKILFYKVKKNNKDVIIEMLICFVNDIVTYESVFIQELLFSEDQNIQEIFKNFNPKTELLIVEIQESTSDYKFLKQIEPKDDTQQYICSICNKVITNKKETKNSCNICSMFLFCSKECSQNKTVEKGIHHHLLHNYLSELKRKEFDFNDFVKKEFYSEIYTNENTRKNKGVVGLYNLGNTCYINSSIQCLSNTKDLIKYFINDYYQNEVNYSNEFGTKGSLLKAYYDLIIRMWFKDGLIKLNPYFFRKGFCLTTKKFINNEQQDAMEFLGIFLNTLHEDLNRVIDKPYMEIGEQKENEKDFEVSERYWNYHKLRENSIIIDLFYGQYKNTIKCEKCFKEKINFEPFFNIPLPIPEKHNFYIFKFISKNSKCKYILININIISTFGQLVVEATKYLNQNILNAHKTIFEHNKNKDYCDNLLRNCIEIAKLDKNKIITDIYSNSDNLTEYMNNYGKRLLDYIEDKEIILFERDLIPDYHLNIYVYPVIEYKESDELNVLSYPVVFSVKPDLKLVELEKIIFDKFKNILNNDTLNNNKNINRIIDINIMHSVKNIKTLIFKTGYKKCPFCQQTFNTSRFCSLYLSFNKTDTVQTLINIFNKKTNSDPLILLARSEFFDKNKKVYDDFNYEENYLINRNINIYDSFDLFSKSESLGKNNLWNCVNCKQHTLANKSISIYRSPNYLIIQLKRFKKKNDGFFVFFESDKNDDKNDTFVYFPEKNLDLTNFIDGPDKFNSIYNLYAVINHKNNHFTAYCRNNNIWIKYDDSKLYRIDNPINENAYILFYIKKDIDK